MIFVFTCSCFKIVPEAILCQSYQNCGPLVINLGMFRIKKKDILKGRRFDWLAVPGCGVFMH